MKRVSVYFTAVTAVALLVDANRAHAQLVVANDHSSGQLWVIDLNPGGTGTRQLEHFTNAYSALVHKTLRCFEPDMEVLNGVCDGVSQGGGEGV